MRLRKKPWIETAMEELKDKYVLMHNLEDYKGHWQERFPGKRLCLEIGCGKGRFLTGMAELHPEKAFIGVDWKTPLLSALTQSSWRTGLSRAK